MREVDQLAGGMWRIAAVALVGLLGSGVADCIAADSAAAPTEQETAMVNRLGTSVTALGVELSHQTNSTPGNYFVSPYSIHTALCMAMAGARGQTADQMARVLQMGAADDAAASQQAMTRHLQSVRGKGGFELSVANALWAATDATFEADFVKLMKDRYGGGLNKVDFVQSAAATRTINQWVGEQTRGKIPELVPAGVLGRDTRLVLTNAIYFKAAWATPFSKQATKAGDFYVLTAGAATETVKADFMHRSGELRYFQDESLQALELPYAGGDEAMLILLPRERAGLEAMQKSLSADRLKKIDAGLEERQVRVALPKFTLRYQMDLARTLQRMGMSDAFSDKADFSGMSRAEKLLISNVIHEAFVDVNEEGTEAAAATAVAMSALAMRVGEPVQFTADHAFCFLIRDRQSGATLFMGTLTKPQAKGK